jgi:hypothetical protein
MENLKQILLVLLAGLGLSVLWLYINDHLFTQATGKPATERQLRGIYDDTKPVSRARYWVLIISNATLLLIGVYVLIAMHSTSAMDRFVWLCLLFFSAASSYPLVVRRRRQLGAEPLKASSNQLSGTPR